jgi:hypothetical protein
MAGLTREAVNFNENMACFGIYFTLARADSD